MARHRSSLTRLAVLFALCYGTVALGGSSLHALVGCSLHTPTLGSDHAQDGKAASPDLASSHTCPLCHFLTQAQIQPERFLVACACLVEARAIVRAFVGQSVVTPRSIRPRAPPRSRLTLPSAG